MKDSAAAMIAARPRRWDACLIPGAIALLTFVVFAPSLKNGFVAWDDLQMFPSNPHYRGLGGSQLLWIWTTFHVGEYMPLTWTTFAIDYLVWELNPFGYHLTNVFLHTLTVLVVYCLGLRLLMLGARGAAGHDPTVLGVAAGLAALVFALHPLRAEPVAWVSARGSILGGLFLLLTLLAYFKARGPDNDGRRTWLAGSVGLFALALLSRSTNVMLPLVLLVLDVYPLRRLGGGAGRWFGPEVRHVWWEKVPFVGLALAAVPLAVLARLDSGGVFGRETYGPLAGAAVAFFGLAFYLRKTFLPGGPSSPLNETPSHLSPLEWPFLLSATAVVTITVLLVTVRRRWPAGLTAWVCYVAILAPTLGIIPFGVQMVADRYSYVACLGWSFLTGAGLLTWWEARRQGRVGTAAWMVSAGLTAVAVAGCGVITWHQVQIWRDSRTLWTYTLSVEPRAAIAHVSLGLVLEREGNVAGAMEHFRQATQIRPHDATVHTNLGRTLSRQGRFSEAIEHLRAAVRLGPSFADAHLTLGGALVAQGRVAEAIERFRDAARIRPDSATIQYNLGVALAELGRLDEAIEHFRTAVRLQPNFVEALAHLDRAIRRLEELRLGRGA